MKRAFRIGLVSAALAAGLALQGATAASAQIAFEGQFRLPHGRVSIGFGSPAFRVGSYAPYGYGVYSRPRYGYGFDSPAFHCRSHGARHSHWVPVRRHHRRWVIVERPIVVVQKRIHRGSDYAYCRHGRLDDRCDDCRYDGHYDRRYDDRYDRHDRYDRDDDDRYDDYDD